MEFSRDPVVNVIYRGIKDPIRLCMDNDAQRAALQLMYAAIDNFATLGLPHQRTKSTRTDYAGWCDRYLKFNSQEEVSGIEWFAARCGLLHSYTAESDLSRTGKVRMISYYGGSGPDIIYNPQKSTDLVMVRVEGLIGAFFSGVDRFVVDLYAKTSVETIELRFHKMFHVLPWKEDQSVEV